MKKEQNKNSEKLLHDNLSVCVPESDEEIISFCDQLTVEEVDVDDDFDPSFCDVILTDSDTCFEFEEIKNKKLKKYYYPGNDNLGYFAAVFYSII